MDKVLFVDFETAYNTKDGYTLKKLSMAEYIRDARFKVFGMGYRWADQGESTWLSGHAAVKQFVESVDWANTVLCAQNVKFDGSILAWIYGAVPKRYTDTLSMSRAVLGTRVPRHSLDVLAKHYGLPPKGDLKTDGLLELTPEQEAQLANYCMHDVDLCLEIYSRQVPLFPASQWPTLDWTIRAFTQPVLRLDTAKLQEIARVERERRATIFQELGLSKTVFSSNDKFTALLTAEGYEVPMKPSPTAAKRGERKLIPALALGDVEFLEMRDSTDARLRDLCEARIAAKSNLLETRAEKFYKLSLTGAFPFDVGFSGAQQTHRFSGGNGAGGNPQNLPATGPGRGLRDAIIAPPGHVLIVADFAAIEARIVAWLAGERKLTAMFALPNGDPYCAYASQLYGRTITKSDEAERKFGKECILALGYNMGAEKFAKRVKVKLGLDISPEKARETITHYRTYYSQIPRLWRELDAYIPLLARKVSGPMRFAPFLRMENGAIVLPSGLRLQYPGLAYDGDEWTYTVYKKGATPEITNLYGGKLLENISQALAGELCKVAIERYRQAGQWGAGQVHDEVIGVARIEDAAASALLLQRAMSMPPAWWPEIRLKAEVGVDSSWAKAKK